MRWPDGITGSGVHCGIKDDGALDLGVLVTEDPIAWAGTFTRNGAAAPAVGWSRARSGEPVRGVIVNSGNANACTGDRGEASVRVTAGAVAALIGCEPEEILVASTGPIGVQLPTELLVAALPEAIAGLGTNVDPFARSLLTTDTTTKLASARSDGAAVVGVAKGAAMLAPNMATMLAFVVTDARVAQDDLADHLRQTIERSFNRICIDACESTNDSVFLLATGRAGEVDPSEFQKALDETCGSLAEQMVRDAEGGSRFVRVRVEGAAGEAQACVHARAVASSALWRAAVYGADPNWGRVAAALGSVDRDLDLDALEIWLGSEIVFTKGAPAGSLAAAAAQMKADELVVRCVVGDGEGAAEFLTSDLTPDYVTLNATGTS